MKYLFSLLILFLTLVASLFIIPKTTFAQGVVTCEKNGATPEFSEACNQNVLGVIQISVPCEELVNKCKKLDGKEQLCAEKLGIFDGNPIRVDCYSNSKTTVTIPISPAAAISPAAPGGAANPSPPPWLKEVLNTDGSIKTALGDLPTTPNELIGQILKILFGIGGGIAFLLMLYGSVMVIFSAGNPDNVKAGQQTISSAVSGLLFIIFSIFLLQFIGVKIFALPGFQ